MDLVSQQVLFKQSVLTLHLKEAFKGLCALELGLRRFSMAVGYRRGKPFSTHRAGLAVLGSPSSTSAPVCWEDHRLPRHLSAKKLQRLSEGGHVFPGGAIPELTPATGPVSSELVMSPGLLQAPGESGTLQ